MYKYIKDVIKREQKRNQRLIDWMSPFEEKATRGALELRQKKGHAYYYLCTREEGRKRRQYLGKADSLKVQQMIGGAFRRKRLQILRENNAVLEEVLERYQRDDRDAVFGRLAPVYSSANRDFFIDKRYEELKAWAREDYEKNDAPFPEKEHYSCDHTRMRSKGECIWYDLLYTAGIPFRYDCVFYYVDESGYTYRACPDFVIQCYDGTLIIIEHLGYLSKDWYSNQFGEKCKFYLKDGYVLGRNYFVTSDDKDGGTDANAIASLVRHVEELFYYGVPDMEID